MKAFLLFAAGVIASLGNLAAANAVLSKDSSRAWFVEFQTSKLIEIDLEKKTCRAINLPALKAHPISGITLSNAGFILCATGNGIWSYDPAKDKSAKVCDAPEGAKLIDLAYDPETGQIIATGISDEMRAIYCLPKNGRRLVKVSTRYGTTVSNPVFAADGNLFFTDSGDLWTGVVVNDNTDADPALELQAYRCAPLAFLVEENTSPPSSGLQDIAIGKGSVYARFARMGGSGWGSVLRFQRPPPILTSTDGERELPPVDTMDWKRLQQICGSVEQLAGDPCIYLCASSDGSLVLYASFAPGDADDTQKLFLIKDHGKPEPVEIHGFANLGK